MNTTGSTDEGYATVLLVGENVIEVASFKYIKRAPFEEHLAQMSALCAENPKASCLLWNTSELVGFEPGNTALALKWIARHTQIRRTAVVTRSQAIASLVHLGRVMIPGLEARSFRLRSEAMTWFATPFTGRPRVRSNRYKAA